MKISTDNDFTTIEGKCSCGSVHFSFDIPSTEFPLKTHLCHCSICRYSTGAPAIFHKVLPTGCKPKYIGASSEAKLGTYLLQRTGSLSHFCSTCGCHVFCTVPDQDFMVISTSILTFESRKHVQISKHVHSDSVSDGGIACMLSRIGDRQLDVWNPKQEGPSFGVIQPEPEMTHNGKDRLRAECHCKGVSFTLGRPTAEVIEDEFLQGFVSPTDSTKWVACFDVCNDCRLVSGTNVIGWCFVALSSCEPQIGADLEIGTAKIYKSSQGVLRSFCGTCGATVFYSCDDRRKPDGRQAVDIATGILRAPEGPMAQNWLTWRSKIGWFDDGKQYDGEFCEALQQGMNDWSVERYGETTNFPIG